MKATPRESGLKEKWAKVADNIPVNETQYNFDTSERERAYVDSQFPPEDVELRARYDEYRAEWYRRAKEFDPGPQPLSVGCELVSTCNLGCNMCYTITDEFKNTVLGGTRMLPWPVVKQVIDECAQLKIPSILFSWRGESTLYRWKDPETGDVFTFPDALKYARDKGIMEVTSLTHGQAITEEMAAAIVDAEPNWISFSIDGLDETYNKVRTPPNKRGSDFNAFDLVVENIKRLVKYRDQAGKKRPQIRCNTVFPAVAKDPEAYRRYMEDIGVDWVTINELLDFRGEELPEDAIRDNWACQYPFQRLVVAASGTILPCTGSHREEGPLVLGRYTGAPVKDIKTVRGETVKIRLPETTLEQAWHSKKLEGIRRMHREGKRTAITPGCKNCRHGAVKHGVNWVPEDWDTENMEWKQGIWRL